MPVPRGEYLHPEIRSALVQEAQNPDSLIGLDKNGHPINGRLVNAARNAGITTQNELGEKTGLDFSTISQFIGLRIFPSLESRQAIAEALKQPEGELFPSWLQLCAEGNDPDPTPFMEIPLSDLTPRDRRKIDVDAQMHNDLEIEELPARLDLEKNIVTEVRRQPAKKQSIFLASLLGYRDSEIARAVKVSQEWVRKTRNAIGSSIQERQTREERRMKLLFPSNIDEASDPTTSAVRAFLTDNLQTIMTAEKAKDTGDIIHLRRMYLDLETRIRTILLYDKTQRTTSGFRRYASSLPLQGRDPQALYAEYQKIQRFTKYTKKEISTEESEVLSKVNAIYREIAYLRPVSHGLISREKAIFQKRRPKPTRPSIDPREE